MPATDRERSNLRERRATHQLRLNALEQQAAIFGFHVEPAVNMEIIDLRGKIAEIDAILTPPKQLSEDTWRSMSPDDRMEYVTQLVLQLNADFESFYLRTRRMVIHCSIVVVACSLVLNALTVATVWWWR